MTKHGLGRPKEPFEYEYPLGSNAPDAYTQPMREANEIHRRFVDSLPSVYVDVVIAVEDVHIDALTAGQIMQQRSEGSNTTEAA